uniref:ZM domain-containing protein n=1 Tax=Caenorhabditis tropicalis TaxID=1561998 RepID=A0A1I7UDI3_9PELO
MDRFRAPEVMALSPASSRRPSNSDLMPHPRPSNFRPFTSRFQPVYQRNPPVYYQEPARYPGPPSLLPSYIPPQYPRESPKARKNRHVPPRGMFQNAKYSDAPEIDEDQIRRTEEMITRMVEKSHRRGYHDYQPNYAMRDSIRQAIYNMGVPEHYRAIPEESRRRGESSRHYGRGDEEDDVVEEPRKRRRPEYEEDEDSEPSRPPRRQEKRRKRHVERVEANSSDEEETLMNRSRGSRATPSTGIPEERAPSHGSKSSKNESPVTGPYLNDSDDDDHWRDSLPFMCKPNGAGAAMFERVGSAINPLPLRDDTKNSYSDVAMMLLGKSLKSLKNPSEIPSRGLQTQILNRSTSWAAPQNQSKQRKTDTSLMREISRIQHPDNISTLQIDASLFPAERPQMPPPRHQSSPISNVFPRENNMTAPSSIPRGPETYGICISDDEEDPKQFDIDEYIAQGASQISYFPADPDISFYAPSTDIFSQEPDSNKSPVGLNVSNMFSNDPNESPMFDVSDTEKDRYLF